MRALILSGALSLGVLGASNAPDQTGPASVLDLSDLDFSEAVISSFNAEYPYLPGHLNPSEYVSYNTPVGDGASMFLFPASPTDLVVVVAFTRWEVPLALEVRIRDDIDWADRRSDVVTKRLTERIKSQGLFATKSKAWGPGALKRIEPAGLVNPVEFEKVSEGLPWVVSESCNGWPMTVVPTRVFAKFLKASSRMQPQHMTLLCENAKKLEVFASEIAGWPAINWSKMHMNVAFPPIVSVYDENVEMAEALTGIKDGNAEGFYIPKLQHFNQEYVAAEMIALAGTIMSSVSNGSEAVKPVLEAISEEGLAINQDGLTTNEDGLTAISSPVYTSSIPGSVVSSFRSEAELLEALKREIGLDASAFPAVSISVGAEGFSNFQERFLLRAHRLYMPSDLLYRVGYDVDGLKPGDGLKPSDGLEPTPEGLQQATEQVQVAEQVSRVFVGEVVHGRYIMLSVPANAVRALIKLPDIDEVGSEEGLRDVARLLSGDYAKLARAVSLVKDLCSLSDPKSIRSSKDALDRFGTREQQSAASMALMQLMETRKLVRLINHMRLDRAPGKYLVVLGEIASLIERLSRPEYRPFEDATEIKDACDRLSGLLIVSRAYESFLKQIGVSPDSLIPTGKPYLAFARELSDSSATDTLVAETLVTGEYADVMKDFWSQESMVGRVGRAFTQPGLSTYWPLVDLFKTLPTGARLRGSLVTSLHTLTMLSEAVPAEVKAKVSATARQSGLVGLSMTTDVNGSFVSESLDATLARIRRVVVATSATVLSHSFGMAFLPRSIPFSVSLDSFNSNSGKFVVDILSNPAYAHTASTMFKGTDLYFPNIIVEGAIANVAESGESVRVLADFVGRALREYSGPYIKVVDGMIHVGETVEVTSSTEEGPRAVDLATTVDSIEAVNPTETVDSIEAVDSVKAGESADADSPAVDLKAPGSSSSGVKALTPYERALRGVKALGGLCGLFGVHRAVISLGLSAEIEHALSQPYMSIKDRSFPISSPMLREFVLGIMEVYTAGALNNAFSPVECAKRLQSDLLGVEVTSVVEIINSTFPVNRVLRFDEVLAARVAEAVMGSAAAPGFGLARFTQLLLGSARIPPPTAAIPTLADTFGYNASSKTNETRHARFVSEQTAATKHVVFLRTLRVVYICDFATITDIRADLEWYWNQKSSA